MATATKLLTALALTVVLATRPGFSLGQDVAQTTEPKPLNSRVEAVLASPGFEHARWGVLVVDSDSGDVIYQHNPDALMRPASVTKLYTTSAAMVELGADYRFVTPVVHTGQVDASGQLHGDLILVAQGDLSLGGRTAPDGSLLFEDHDHSYAGFDGRGTIVSADPLAGLDHLARDVASAGVKSIDGDVLIDDRLFDEAQATGSGPRRVTPVLVNDNLIDLVVTPAAKAGERASVRLVPETSFVSADIRVETTDSAQPARMTVTPVGPRRFSVRGRVPVGGSPSVLVYEVEEPSAFARALFIECLRRRGVDVPASPLGVNDASKLPTREQVSALPKLTQYTSPPLREYLRVILKVSQNLHASTLPLLLAAHRNERTLNDGLRIEGQVLKSLGVDIGSISFGGGAGGDRADLVTPRATVTLLRAMSKRQDFAGFEAALPILGRDGTLATSVAPDSPARGHARAKTGTYVVQNGLTGEHVLTSKALAGYLETASGRHLVFAFFLNDATITGDLTVATDTAGRLMGRLCEVFYQDAVGTPSKPVVPSPAKPAVPASP